MHGLTKGTRKALEGPRSVASARYPRPRQSVALHYRMLGMHSSLFLPFHERFAPRAIGHSQHIARLHILRNAKGADEINGRGLATRLKLHTCALGKQKRALAIDDFQIGYKSLVVALT